MKKKGFTLIELLVVIAVIGLLASIVLVALGPARKKARDARRHSDIRQISLAMEMQYDDNKEKYSIIAVDANDRIVSIDWNADGDITDSGESASPFKIGDYIVIPEDPSGNGQYYAVENNGDTDNYKTSYCVYAELEIVGGYVSATEQGVETADSPCIVP